VKYTFRVSPVTTLISALAMACSSLLVTRSVRSLYSSTIVPSDWICAALARIGFFSGSTYSVVTFDE
jgi:hypothetical protein